MAILEFRQQIFLYEGRVKARQLLILIPYFFMSLKSSGVSLNEAKNSLALIILFEGVTEI